MSDPLDDFMLGAFCVVIAILSVIKIIEALT
jgi:hypothetical protein